MKEIFLVQKTVDNMRWENYCTHTTMADAVDAYHAMLATPHWKKDELRILYRRDEIVTPKEHQ